MKSSYVLLAIGAGLLVVGLVIAGISVFAVTKQVLEGSVLIEPTPLEPGLGLSAVLVDLPAGRQLVLSIDSEPSDVPLNAVVTEGDGDAIGVFNITNAPFTTTMVTRESGNHTLEIRNVGTSPAIVSGALIHSPVTGEGGGVSIEDDPGLQTLITFGVGILAGIVLIIAGIIILIIGAIKHFRSKKPPENMPGG